MAAINFQEKKDEGYVDSYGILLLLHGGESALGDEGGIFSGRK